MRPTYHFSVPDNWKNDPQRPIYLDGEYHYYYLYNADYIDGGGGTAWRRATTRDHVSFRDRGVAIPKFSNANGDCWSGCLVVDERRHRRIWRRCGHRPRDAGAPGEAGAVPLVLDGSRAIVPPRRGCAGAAEPRSAGLPRPEGDLGRRPRALVHGNAEGQKIGFYVSADLRSWQRVGQFVRTDLGVLECPDIFRMTADDGTSHWILGMSANGKGRGLPATYAYWTGRFDGIILRSRPGEPQWLDYGFDFYGAVTYPASRRLRRRGRDSAPRNRLGQLLGLPAQHAHARDRRLQRRRHDRARHPAQAGKRRLPPRLHADRGARATTRAQTHRLGDVASAAPAISMSGRSPTT